MEVVFDIGANDNASSVMEKVRSGLKSTASGVQDFSSTLGSAKSMAFQFFEGLMGWAAVEKVISVIDQLKDKVVEVAKESTILSARVETLGIVMHQIGNTTGYSAAETDKYSEGVRAMGITTSQSKDAIVKMMQAHIDLSKATDLARIAQDAAVIANTNSSEAMNRLVYGIQSGQVEVLRTMGINVNFENSYASLAKQLEKNTDQLTEVEKTQARTNVVMDAGKAIAGSYEASMGTVGKQMTSLPRYIEEAKLQFGELFKPALSVIITGITQNLKDLGEWFKELRESGKLDIWAEQLTSAVVSVRDGIRTFASFFVENWDLIKTALVAGWDIVKSVFEGLSGFLQAVPADLNAVNISTEEAKKFILNFAAAVEYMGKSIGYTFGFFGSVIKSAIELIINQFAPAGKILLGVMTLDLTLIKQGWNEYVSNAKNAITDVTNSFKTMTDGISSGYNTMISKMEGATVTGSTKIKKELKSVVDDAVMQGPQLPVNWLNPTNALAGLQKIFKASRDTKGAVGEIGTAFDGAANQAQNAGVTITSVLADNELNAGLTAQRVIEYQVGITNSIKEWQRQLDDGNAKQALVMMQKEWGILQEKISKIRISDMTPEQAATAIKPLNDELNKLKEGLKVLATPHLDLSELKKDEQEVKELFKDIGVLGVGGRSNGAAGSSLPSTPTTGFKNSGLTIIEDIDAVKDALGSIPTEGEYKVEFFTEASPVVPFTEGMNNIKNMMSSLPTGSEFTVKFEQLARDYAYNASSAATAQAYHRGGVPMTLEAIMQGYEQEGKANQAYGQMVALSNSLRQQQGNGGGTTVNYAPQITVQSGAGGSGQSLAKDIDQQLADDIKMDRSKSFVAIKQKLGMN